MRIISGGSSFIEYYAAISNVMCACRGRIGVNHQLFPFIFYLVGAKLLLIEAEYDTTISIDFYSYVVNICHVHKTFVATQYDGYANMDYNCNIACKQKFLHVHH